MDNMKQKTIVHNKELIRAIAEDCDYNIYEVEDVFDSMVRVFTDVLSKGNAIKLEHLFCISPKVNQPRRYCDWNTREIKISSRTVTLSIKPAKYLLHAMKPERNPESESKKSLPNDES